MLNCLEEIYMSKENNVIGIIGLGYVGLPLAKSYLQADTKVLGFDVDIAKVENLNQGKST